jgi:hypothetical protein
VASYRILNNYARPFDDCTTERAQETLPLCDRCGEEIALANDLDQAGDIDRRRHLVLVAGKPRRLAPTLWRLFTVLSRRSGDVIDDDRLRAELYCEMDDVPAAGTTAHARESRSPVDAASPTRS